ncbi:MAG: carbonic anhydrase family protein [Thermodesulfobacteriota bacterium]
MKTIKISSLILVGAFAFTLSAYSAALAGEKGHGAPHWTYEGEGSPDKWGELSPDYATCSQGKTQSPIDIKEAAQEELTPIDFSYSAIKTAKVLNNGHTLQVNYDNGSMISINGKEYDLVQFHFHAPSEHTVNGKPADMELHFVHKNGNKKLAVVGVLMVKGAENETIAKLWANLPKNANDSADVKAAFNAGDLLPVEKGYFNYSGSLTTPPCSEGVNWLVLKNPIEMSESQIKAFAGIIGKSNRPVQPVNKRKLKSTNF